MAHAIVDVGLGHPPLQGRLRDVEIDAHLGEHRVRPTSDRYNITLELRREPLGHVDILPETHRVPHEMSTNLWAAPTSYQANRSDRPRRRWPSLDQRRAARRRGMQVAVAGPAKELMWAKE